jgi:hypothetical protein
MFSGQFLLTKTITNLWPPVCEPTFGLMGFAREKRGRREDSNISN